MPALALVLTLVRLPDGAGDRVPLAQAVLLHLAQRHVDVVRAGQVAGRADERVAVEDVEDAADRQQDVVLGDLRLVEALATLAATSAALAVAVATAAAAAAALLVVLEPAALAILLLVAVVLADLASFWPRSLLTVALLVVLAVLLTAVVLAVALTAVVLAVLLTTVVLAVLLAAVVLAVALAAVVLAVLLTAVVLAVLLAAVFWRSCWRSCAGPPRPLWRSRLGARSAGASPSAPPSGSRDCCGCVRRAPLAPAARPAGWSARRWLLGGLVGAAPRAAPPPRRSEMAAIRSLLRILAMPLMPRSAAMACSSGRRLPLRPPPARAGARRGSRPRWTRQRAAATRSVVSVKEPFSPRRDRQIGHGVTTRRCCLGGVPPSSGYRQPTASREPHAAVR